MVGHYLHRKGSVEICITISGVVLVPASQPELTGTEPTNISDSLVRWKIFNWKTFTDYTSSVLCLCFVGRNGLKCEFEIHLEILLEYRDSKLS